MSVKPTNNEKLKKERRKVLKQVFVSLLFGVLILLMIISLAPGGGSGRDQQSPDRIRIAEINRTTYDYRQTSVFNYIFGDVKQNMNSRYRGMISDDFIAKYAFQESVRMIINYAMIYDFCKSVGITPSREMLKSTVGQVFGTQVPPEGFIDYVRMQYANQAVLGNNGDIMNATSPITFGEMYSYFDLVNYVASADAIYIDITNFLVSKVSPAESDTYYLENIASYADKLIVNDIAVTNKQLTREIIFYAKTNGWQAAVDKYSTQIVYTPNLTLSNAQGLSKRFVAALGLPVDTVLSNAVYENTLYHVVQVVTFPNFESISLELQDMLRAQYVEKNFDSMKQKYANEMQSLITSAREKIVTGQPMNVVAQSLGISFVRTGNISPINLLLKSSEGETINLPVLDRPECMDFLFKSSLNTISQVFTTDGFFLVMKLNYRGGNETIDYQSIDEEIAYRYANFKSQALSYDWYANLETNSSVTIFSNDFQDLF